MSGKAKNITIVTGLFDIERSGLKCGFERSIEFYQEKLKELLRMSAFGFKMVVHTESPIAEKLRGALNDAGVYRSNIKIIETEKSKLRSSFFPFFDAIQKIRTRDDWGKGAEWLKESPQKKLEYYNPVVMSKMFFLQDAMLENHFDTDYFVWLDAGILNTVSMEHLKQIENCEKYMQKFLFLEFPYETETEIHGFCNKKMNELSKTKVDGVCRGGFFGGHSSTIKETFAIYYQMLDETLNIEYDMGTEECLFTIITRLHSDKFNVAKIEGNGLIYTFFENVKTGKVEFKNGFEDPLEVLGSETVDVYMLAFDSSSQARFCLESYREFFEDNENKIGKKILVNNSGRGAFRREYEKLCEEFSLKYIETENLGICGARQFVAEHFDKFSDSTYYVFLEDDMSLRDSSLWLPAIEIMTKEKLDFLKLNFDEIFGDNTRQWAFINLDNETREEYWPNRIRSIESIPNIKNLTLKYLDSNPKTLYSLGGFYYCNWPLLFSRKGNKAIFIDGIENGKISEQKLMTKAFKLQKKDKIKCAVLLKNFNKHDRKFYYNHKKRKES